MTTPAGAPARMTPAEVTGLGAALLEMAARHEGPYVLPPTMNGEDKMVLIGTLLSAWEALANLQPDDCAEVAAALRLVAIGQDIDGATAGPNGY